MRRKRSASALSGGGAFSTKLADCASLGMVFVTIYALFGDDLRLCLFRKGAADHVFSTLSTLACGCFFVEFWTRALLSVEYARLRLWFIPTGFYFWVDLLTASSLVLDVGWLWDGNRFAGMIGSSSALRVGRTLRSATRTARFVRVVRALRILSFASRWPVWCTSRLRGRQAAAIAPAAGGGGAAAAAAPARSDLSKRLSELTARRVVILVLLMLFVVPLYEVDYWDEESNLFATSGLDVLHRYPQDMNITDDVFRASVEHYASRGGCTMQLEVCVAGCARVWGAKTIAGWLGALPSHAPTQWDPSCLQSPEQIEANWRTEERIVIESRTCYGDSGGLGCYSRAVFDVRRESQLLAVLSIAKTMLILLVLATGALVFTKDAEQLVIRPLERMVETVKAIASDPLAAVKQLKLERSSGDHEEESYETVLLEQTLAKIGTLLAVGFGEAGSEIIAKSLQRGGEMSAAIPGQKCWAVFGFCDIRKFTDATECLQEQVMTFVNHIGGIVHSAVDQMGGSPNKNIGDAFLLVWKLPCNPETVRKILARHGGGSSGHAQEQEREGEHDVDSEGHAETGVARYGRDPAIAAEVASAQRAQKIITRTMDNALNAFLLCMLEIEKSNKNGVLAPYQSHPKILERFGADYKVKLGYGLHVGWAIEGAIGSKYKIDASYLSPNVNIAEQLEAGTKQFGVPLLLSSDFYENLSIHAKCFCRRLDRVTVKGRDTPMGLYTFDVSLSASDSIAFAPALMEDKWVDFGDAVFAQLQGGVPGVFFDIFRTGIDSYLAGDWAKAKLCLENAVTLKPRDGPSNAILKRMAARNYLAPSDWRGHRAL